MQLLLSKFADHFRQAYSLDMRSLGLMRIGIGFVVIIDLLIRLTDLEAHYADMGVFPMWVLFQHKWNPYYFSVHTSSGLWQVQLVLFAISIGCALCVMVGYKTRWFTIASWLLMLSMHNRNPMILQGGDDLLRLLLFWGMFLPWGERYSYDAISSASKNYTRTSFFGVAGIAYMVQVASVYFFSAMLKSSPEWHTEGTAIYYALSLDQLVFPVGKLIYPYPELLKFLTLSVYYIEVIIPFILFIPLFNWVFRCIFIAVLIMLHIGIALTLFVGLFYLISFVALLGLIPTQVMNRLTKTVSTGTQAVRMRLLPSHLIREGMLVVLMAYCALWNWGEIPEMQHTLAPQVRWIGSLLRIDQHWGMFAPSVFKDDGWYILEGTTADGGRIDLNRDGAPLTYDKPESVVSLFKNDRWRKYGENYLFVDNDFMRPFYCNYLTRIWNQDDSHPKITRLDVVYMKEVTAPDYQPVQPQREVLCSCSDQ